VLILTIQVDLELERIERVAGGLGRGTASALNRVMQLLDASAEISAAKGEIALAARFSVGRSSITKTPIVSSPTTRQLAKMK